MSAFESLKGHSKDDFDKETQTFEHNLLGEYESVVKRNQKANDNMNNLKTKEYPKLFYYFDGLNGTAVSQSFHPAGIVVSPISLPDNYGIFWNNEGKHIMCINMDEIHDGAGLVKYDLLGLNNIQIIRKTCEYAGIKYPKSHELNWNDEKVWDDMIKSPVGVFQFGSPLAYDSIKRYEPHSINDLSMINAALRPSGASYRDKLLDHEVNRNPSPLIDKLLEKNNGWLIFQEDTIRFLQDVCGLSGSAADSVRRGIARKKTDLLNSWIPKILEGYCNKSDQPREIAEQEAKSFIKIIEDSASYQFGLNHSTGYSMIGYTCAYYRYYYPEEFIAAYLNCAGNNDDIANGTELAKLKGVTIHNIKFGKSDAEYSIDKKNHALYKGIESIKYLNAKIAHELKDLSKNKYDSFIELLHDIDEKTSVNSRQLTILIGLNFFSDFGKNRYLMSLNDIYNKFAAIKQVKKDKMESLGLTEYLMQKYSNKETAKLYKEIDNMGLVKELCNRIENKSLSVIEQIKFEKEYLNYVIYKNPKVHKSYYIVTEYDTYKDARKPYLTLRNIKTGDEIKTKITSVKIYERDPFGLYSVLKINKDGFSDQKKRKMVDGTWTITDEKEQILTEYEVIKRYKV